jgi:CheY-like chemotaxis protein
MSDRSHPGDGLNQTTVSERSQNKEGLTVLFVGTPPVDIEKALRASSSRPMTVAVVGNGREAIQWLSKAGETTTVRSRPDLIVLQFGFRSPDGKTLLVAIKSSPYLRTVPVVVLTTDDADTKAVYEYDGNARVAAPSSREDYGKLIQSIGQFWFKWVRYPPECLFAEET